MPEHQAQQSIRGNDEQNSSRREGSPPEVSGVRAIEKNNREGSSETSILRRTTFRGRLT